MCVLEIKGGFTLGISEFKKLEVQLLAWTLLSNLRLGLSSKMISQVTEGCFLRWGVSRFDEKVMSGEFCLDNRLRSHCFQDQRTSYMLTSSRTKNKKLTKIKPKIPQNGSAIFLKVLNLNQVIPHTLSILPIHRMPH